MKSDAKIQKHILEEFEWDPAVLATNIGVIVKDGVVTLTGHLGTYAEKQAAESAVQRVAGVRAMAIEMDVHLATENIRNDTDIAAAANHALQWSAAVPEGQVIAKVEDGWVILVGGVAWEYQRRAAEHAVQAIVGVVGITNLVAVMPSVSPHEIHRGIEAALTRQAKREARHIQVLVDGSRVTLKGKVHSWAECEAVQGVAWSAPGVSGLVSELTIE